MLQADNPLSTTPRAASRALCLTRESAAFRIAHAEAEEVVDQATPVDESHISTDGVMHRSVYRAPDFCGWSAKLAPALSERHR